MVPKILVVDDEVDACEVVSNYLSRRGYSVITAAGPNEALSKLLREKPALVLLDIHLPGMDGIECLRRIKKLDKEVLVIMVTCVTDIDIAKQALELGAIDYLTKPLNFSTLETTISNYLYLRVLNEFN